MATTVVWGPTAASAHNSDVTIAAVCGTNPAHIQVSLSIFNSQGVAQPMTLHNVVAVGFAAPIGAQSGDVLVGGPGGQWTEFTFSLPAANSGTISYDYDTSWANGVVDNNNFAQVTLPSDCDPPVPEATVVGDCATSSAMVSLVNNGGGEAVFTIVVDGQEFGPTPTVATTDAVLVPLAEDVPVEIKVYAGEQTLVASVVITNDCKQGNVDGTAVDCAEGGVLVTLSSAGESPVDLTVYKDGIEVETVLVGEAPVEVLVPMDEDEEATIEVKDGDTVLAADVVQLDCEPPPTTTTAGETLGTTGTAVSPSSAAPSSTPAASQPQSGTLSATGSLPVTGAAIVGTVTVGLALLLGGAALVGITRRRFT